MRGSRKPENQAPRPANFDAALDERDRMRARPRPSLRSQMITALKLFTAAGMIALALWLIDQIVRS